MMALERKRRGALAVAVLAVAVAVAVHAQDGEEVERGRIVQAIAEALGVPATWVILSSAQVVESEPAGRALGYMCLCTVTGTRGNLLAKLRVWVAAGTYRVGYITCVELTPDELAQVAREFVSTTFDGWSEQMVLKFQASSPIAFEQPLRVTPSRATSFYWAEKRGEAWTGTWVSATFIHRMPAWPETYDGYVAQPRSIEDVKIPRERAVEVALAEAGRRGLADPEVKQADLYLDHHLWHFPHWMIEVAEPQPRGQATHPLHTSVMVDAVSGEVLDPGAMMPDGR
ncbi:MAG: hypothetical protein AB7Y46_03300 [Armatimonadota bacterium]